MTFSLPRALQLRFLVLTLCFTFALSFAQESPFKAGQEWLLEVGHETWFIELRKETNGVWLADGTVNESGEEYPVTLNLLTPEEQQELELPEAAYWAFSASIPDKVKSDSGWAFKCVFDPAKADRLESGEIVSVTGERFDYTITVAGPQLSERGNSCTAKQPG
jgi:hypothetical protein